MTCDAMLNELLDAELDTLEGRGDGPVARHVRECARCRAVARHLVSETRALGAEVAVVPARRRPVLNVPLLPVVGLAAAAAAALLVVRPGFRRDAAPPPVAGPVASAPSIPASRPGGAIADAARPAVGRPGRREARHGIPAAPVGRAYRRVPEVIAARWEATPVRVSATAARGTPAAPGSAAGFTDTDRAHRPPGLVVEPAPGTHALVMQTADPKVTVVWLY
jgi:hypothetical protein